MTCENNTASSEVLQPERYTAEELKKLKDFMESIEKDESRAVLACWGNHSEHTNGW